MIRISRENIQFLILEVTYFLTYNFEKLMVHSPVPNCRGGSSGRGGLVSFLEHTYEVE